MTNYFKESLFWIKLSFLKPVSIATEIRALGSEQALQRDLKAAPVQLLITLTVITLAAIVAKLLEQRFNLIGAVLASVVCAIVGGVGFGVGRELAGGLMFGIGFGLGLGLYESLGIGFCGGLSVGLGFGMYAALVVTLGGGVGAGPGAEFGHGLGVGRDRGLGSGLFFGSFIGVVGALGVGLVTGWGSDGTVGFREALYFLGAYSPLFLIAYFRPFQLLPYVWQFLRLRTFNPTWRFLIFFRPPLFFKPADPFQLLRNSPVYWDEAVAIPFPFLSYWLERLVESDPQRAKDEIINVARLPYQRRAAQRALVDLFVRDLQHTDTIEKMASVDDLLLFLRSDDESFLKGLGDAERHIGKVSELANDYLLRVTPTTQIKALEELRQVVELFRKRVILAGDPLGRPLQAIADRWIGIVQTALTDRIRQVAADPLPNPFVVGNPLNIRDSELFKGRRDVTIPIEESVINPGQRPTLMLYGRRRIGKTSTLLNLPRLLSSKFVPVFIDCQDAKWRDGDEAFCYHICAAVDSALRRDIGSTRNRPVLQEFEKYPLQGSECFLTMPRSLWSSPISTYCWRLTSTRSLRTGLLMPS